MTSKRRRRAVRAVTARAHGAHRQRDTRGILSDLAVYRAEHKTLRYRLLHVAARIVRRARRVILRLPASWPWALELAQAYRRVRLLTA